MSPRSPQLALDDAYRQLHELVERYGPLNRGKGVNMFEGVDMIDHQIQGLPLNKLGVMVVAAAKIKQWEAVVGQGYINKLDEEQAIAQTEEDALKLLDIARMQPDGEQQMESELPALRCKPSSVVVNKRYLHRLELENDLYRRHLSRYEQGIADKLFGLVSGILSEIQGDAGGPGAVTAHQHDKLTTLASEAMSDTEPKTKGSKTAGQEEEKVLVILQRNFSENRSRGNAA